MNSLSRIRIPHTINVFGMVKLNPLDTEEARMYDLVMYLKEDIKK